jgi:NAD(P)H-hydrate epimerase
MYDMTDSDSLEDALVHAGDADVVVDAVFGTGLTRVPEGIYAEAIRSINELALPIVAVDVPSGVDASSATPFDPHIEAAVTVTFATPKICHVFEPASISCGEVIVANISIPRAAIEDEGVTLSLTTPVDVRPHIAPRLASTHKGTYGHVGIVAGSFGRSGAAVMSARGAIRAGAGLVSVATDPEAARLVNAGAVEAMTFPVELTSSLPEVTSFLAGKSAILIGPGLRDDSESYSFVRTLLGAIEQPAVIDASALNAFAGRVSEINPKARPRVITPHPGEMARLLGSTTRDVTANRIEVARDAARRCRCVVVLKGYQTLIADPEGHVNVNPTGNPGMASGGMGDVLAGIIAAFLARGIDPFDAACAGVYLHGFAGDMLKEEMGDIGLAAMDLAERLPLAIRKLRE